MKKLITPLLFTGCLVAVGNIVYAQDAKATSETKPSISKVSPETNSVSTAPAAPQKANDAVAPAVARKENKEPADTKLAPVRSAVAEPGATKPALPPVDKTAVATSASSGKRKTETPAQKQQ